MRLTALTTLAAASVAALATGLPAMAPAALPDVYPTPKPTPTPKPSGGGGRPHVKPFDGGGGQELSAPSAHWATAAPAYQRARTSGTSPQTRGEYATCAAYWTNWAKALKANRLSAADLRPLPTAVRLPAAQKTAQGWLAALKPKGVSEADLAAEQAATGARIDAAIGGDAGAASAVIEWLGLCPVPKG
ncbi:hypothetical protein [Sphingomonas sp. G-3-2-10]|uniref:hypothetical protein n=1 Tax=Sphingomonas sp. G-3-2-10 TaxID=2728838 RepID=UPI00146C786A|nr:hypothetical protein [Sphingomonas sp. G-3-2-10]NML07313.1 hypothetical protein [Sphingomonas sp. G-3-2-10]